jgi:hypothetical protein
MDIIETYWCRGEEATKSGFLYNPDTKKYDVCGFFLREYVGRLAGAGKAFRFPSQYAQYGGFDRHHPFPSPVKWMLNEAMADSEITLEIIRINDEVSYTDDERISKINTILMPLGHLLTVVHTDTNPKKPKSLADVIAGVDSNMRTVLGNHDNILDGATSAAVSSVIEPILEDHLGMAMRIEEQRMRIREQRELRRMQREASERMQRASSALLEGSGR